ncbi:MAG: nitrate/nitrite transporter NarK [Polaribacter sp.]|jgi:nitrate/nitrite transporter NarK
MDNLKKNTRSNWKMLFALIFAGEMIFSLPFHVARFFRPALLENLSLSNTELGDTFAIYGIIAMLCYFPGGIIADYFSAKRLLTFSLIATALGGLVFIQFPTGFELKLLFGYWGFTSVLLFWAGMIKATREWGGSNKQGKAFGLLDGGRGLVAAIMSSIAVIFFSFAINESNSELIQANPRSLQSVIVFYTFITLLAALFTWMFIPEIHDKSERAQPWIGVQQSIRSSKIWLQSLIVICAYSGFKGADNYGLYAVQVLSMDQVESASFTSATAYLRPIGAILAGFLADRFSARRVTIVSFALLTVLYGLLAITWSPGILFYLAMFNLIFSYVAVFALRGVYFALMQESKIPLKQTGAAVGIVSLIGYTPDIFFAPISGRLLDMAPGAQGFQYYFTLMMSIAVIGLVASFILNRKNLR